MNKVEKVFDSILKVVSLILSFMLIAMVIIVCLQTFFRYVVKLSLPWSEELSRYIFVVITSCGFGLAVSKGSLIRISFIDSILSPLMRKIMQVLYTASGVAVCYVLVRYNLDLVRIGLGRNTGSLAPLKYGHIYLLMETGFVLALIAALIQFIKAAIVLVQSGKKEGRV